MIDDTGLIEFNGSSRARRIVFTLAAISLAACADAAPPDDAVAAELSTGEVLGLCDELRDEVQRDDRPIACDGGDRYWVLPSNQACLSADLSYCTATVGQLRRCHEAARQAPCTLQIDALSPIDRGTPFDGCQALEGCALFIATTGYTVVPTCDRAGVASLQAFDGVYEVAGLPESWGNPLCAALPELLERASHFVLVSTEASGAPEVILQSCDAIADCQALAREIRATGSARGGEPSAGYNHLVACVTPEASDALALQSVLPDVPSCQIMSVPTISVTGEPSALSVRLSGVTGTEVSPGCGYIIPAVSAELGPCAAMKEFRAVLAAPL